MAAPKNMTPAQRTLRAKIASHTMWANCDNRTARTAAARKAAADRFITMVDPDGVLAPEERATRADSARKAHFSRMAAKSAKSRAAKAARRPISSSRGSAS